MEYKLQDVERICPHSESLNGQRSLWPQKIKEVIGV